MITFNNIGYMGRLGNQMFQFASTLAVGKRKGYEVKFPLENCRDLRRIGPIDLNTGALSDVKCDLLDCFDIPAEYFTSSSRIQINSFYSESIFEYDGRIESIPDGCNLSGYFQTEKYFTGSEDEIKKIFSFKKEIIEEGNRILNEIIGNGELVSIHVRRGDYTLYPDHHPMCSPNYYYLSIEEIKKISGENVNIVIFSDDKKWCYENMSNYIGNNFTIPETENPYVELYMMTKCNYHIIANSSFSWWGSWLSNSKVTICPSVWLGPAINGNTEDVCPEGWISI
jgi:hypothetical protein